MKYFTPVDKPVIFEMNVPIPDPSVVFVDKAIVGFVEVPQTTPLAVTTAPPSELTEPPLFAEVIEILEAATFAADGTKLESNITIESEENLNLTNDFYSLTSCDLEFSSR